MEKTGSHVAVLALTLLACGVGCGKTGGSGQKPQTLEEGMTQLQAAFDKASPEVQSNFYQGVTPGIRYANYPQALEAMDRISADPSLNAQQKKLVNDVIELLKTAAQNQEKAAAPSH